MKIPEQVIETVKDRVDIVSVVGRHVALRKQGRDYVGLCPFHKEKTPSFNVIPDKKIFHCFGCKESGTAFNFLMKLQGLSFPEVVRSLAKDVGVEIPEREETPEEREAERIRQRLLAINERALHWYVDQLHGSHGVEARQYLHGRGIKDTQASDFELGFGGAGRDGLWQALGKTDPDKEDLVKAGLCVSTDRGVYDRFFGRVIFPVRDEKWRVVGFGGRVFGERAGREGVAKYLNSSESAVYDKSQALYRIPQAAQKARKGEPIVVVEGYFDAMALEACGLAAVAVCGTALTPRHAQILQRLGGKVVLCWDGDAAGDRAVQKAGLVLLPLKIDTRIAVLPIGDDPDTYVARTGPAGGVRLVQEAESLPTWVVAQAARQVEEAGDDIPKKTAAIRGLGWLFGAVPEGLEKELYLDQAAKKLAVPRDVLQRELLAGRHAAVHAAPRPVTTSEAPRVRPVAPPAPVRIPRLKADERDLVRLVGEHPHRAPVLEEARVADHMVEAVRQLVAFARVLVHEHGPFSPGSPPHEALRESVQHPEIQMILGEIHGGRTLVFVDEETEERAVQDMIRHAERIRLERQLEELSGEIRKAEAADEQDRLRTLLEHKKAVQAELNRMRPRRGADRTPTLH